MRLDFVSCRIWFCFALCAVLLTPPLVRAADEQSPAANESRDLYGQTSWEDFQKREDAQKEIDPEHFDSALLSAAIFHRSNFIRAKHDRSQLAYSEKAAAAAQKHSEAMANGDYLSHGTPNRKQNVTPWERLKNQGLNPGFAAENIAFNFLLRYESGKPFFMRQENGKTVFSYEPNGKPLQRNTYVSFAESIVEQWMNSPPHRENLLSKEPTQLGVGAALSKEKSGFDTIFCDQDFFAPMPSPPQLQ